MTGLHKDTAAVTQIHFLYGQVRPCFNHCSLLGVDVCFIEVVEGFYFKSCYLNSWDVFSVYRGGYFLCWMITAFTYGRLCREKTDHIWWRFTASTCLAGQASRAPGKALFLILVAFPQICLAMPFIITSKPWPLCCFLLLCSATRVTVMLLKLSCDLLALGTEGGGVHFLELPSLTLLNKSLFQDEIMQRWELPFQCPYWPCHVISSSRCYHFTRAVSVWKGKDSFFFFFGSFQMYSMCVKLKSQLYYTKIFLKSLMLSKA